MSYCHLFRPYFSCSMKRTTKISVLEALIKQRAQPTANQSGIRVAKEKLLKMNRQMNSEDKIFGKYLVFFLLELVTRHFF